MNESYKFSCDKCLYFTNIKQNYDSHLLSNRHNDANIIRDKNKTFDCAFCNKYFFTYNGLYKHNKKCKSVKENNEQITLLQVIETKNEIKFT